MQILESSEYTPSPNMVSVELPHACSHLILIVLPIMSESERISLESRLSAQDKERTCENGVVEERELQGSNEIEKEPPDDWCP